MSPATVNRQFAFLKHVYSIAIRDGKAEMNPVSKFRMLRESSGRVRYLTDEEEARLAATLGTDEDSFPNSEGNRDLRWAQHTVPAAISAAKIEDFRFHDLRHAFASRLAMEALTRSQSRARWLEEPAHRPAIRAPAQYSTRGDRETGYQNGSGRRSRTRRRQSGIRTCEMVATEWPFK